MMIESDAPWRVGQIAYTKLCGLAFCGYVAKVSSDTLVITVAQPDDVDLPADITSLAWEQLPVEGADYDMSDALVRLPTVAAAKSRPLHWTPVVRFSSPPSMEGISEAMRADSGFRVGDVSSSTKSVVRGLQRVGRTANARSALGGDAAASTSRGNRAIGAALENFIGAQDDGDEELDAGVDRPELNLRALQSLLGGPRPNGGAESQYAGSKVGPRNMERATAASSMGRHSPQAMAPVGGDNGNDGPSLEGLQQILDASDGSFEPLHSAAYAERTQEVEQATGR